MGVMDFVMHFSAPMDFVMDFVAEFLPCVFLRKKTFFCDKFGDLVSLTREGKR